MTERERRLIYNAMVVLHDDVQKWESRQVEERGGYNASDKADVWAQLWLSCVMQLDVEGPRPSSLGDWQPKHTYSYDRLPYGPRQLSQSREDLEGWLSARGRDEPIERPAEP